MSEQEFAEITLRPIGMERTEEVRVTNLATGAQYRPFTVTFDVPDNEALLGALVAEGNHTNPVQIGLSRRQFIQAHLKSWSLEHDFRKAETWRALDPLVTLEIYNVMCASAREAKNS